MACPLCPMVGTAADTSVRGHEEAPILGNLKFSDYIPMTSPEGLSLGNAPSPVLSRWSRPHGSTLRTSHPVLIPSRWPGCPEPGVLLQHLQTGPVQYPHGPVLSSTVATTEHRHCRGQVPEWGAGRREHLSGQRIQPVSGHVQPFPTTLLLQKLVQSAFCYHQSLLHVAVTTPRHQAPGAL